MSTRQKKIKVIIQLSVYS